MQTLQDTDLTHEESDQSVHCFPFHFLKQFHKKQN